MSQSLGNNHIEELRIAFNLFDSEGSGFMNTSQLKVALRALGFEPKPDEIKKLLTDVKQDRQSQAEQSIDFGDFIKIMEIKLGETETEEELQRAFNYFACDQGDQITFDRLQEVAGELNEPIDEEGLQAMITETTEGMSGKGVSLDQFKRILTGETKK